MVHKQQIILAWVDGESQRSIAKRLQLNRKTVRKYISTYNASLSASTSSRDSTPKLPSTGIVSAPQYDSSKRQRRCISPAMSERINELLRQNAEKRARGDGKQCLKATDIQTVLASEGHLIKYSTLTAYIRQHVGIVQEAFIRQNPPAGHRVEFDWGFVKLCINGQRRAYSLAVFTSAFSTYRYALLFHRQDMSSFLQAHVAYFSTVKGVARQLVYDNMRTAVAKFSYHNRDKVATESLLKLSVYYGFGIQFCNVGKGHEKGHVERSVEYIRRKAFAHQDTFRSLAAANVHLSTVLQILNERTVQGETQSIRHKHEIERASMRACPTVPYDIGQMKRLKVNSYSCIKLSNNFYSVPDHLVGHRVDVRTYPDYIIIYDADNKQIAHHKRLNTSHKYCLDLAHFLTTLSHKPAALKHAACLQQADQSLQDIFHTHFEQQPKAFIETLQWLKLRKLGIPHLQKAIAQCLAISPQQCPSLDKIIFFLDQTQQAKKQQTPQISPSPSQQDPQHITQACQAQLSQIQQLLDNNSQNNKHNRYAYNS